MRNALLAALLAAAPFATADDSTKCSNKNPNVVNAIGKFCQAFPLSVPTLSTKESRGIESEHGGQTVCITSTCTRRQLVTQETCFKQLYNICATGDKKGEIACSLQTLWQTDEVLSGLKLIADLLSLNAGHGWKRYDATKSKGYLCQLWTIGTKTDCQQAVKSYKRDLSEGSIDDDEENDHDDVDIEDEDAELKARNPGLIIGKVFADHEASGSAADDEHASAGRKRHPEV